MTQSAYRKVIDVNINGQTQIKGQQRFQSIETRKDASALPADAWKGLAVTNAYSQRWKGLIHNKGPFEIALYQMLLGELRPQTIIEFGALHGGSAVWLADVSSALGARAKIVSVDIDISLVASEARSDSRIRFIEGDANHVKDIFSREEMESWQHPWLIIEDCHVNTEGILEYFYHNGLRAGDYLIAEDTNNDAWDAWRSEWMDEDRIARGKEKLTKVRSWISAKPDILLDTLYLDLYGYNVSKNWNSVMRKMESEFENGA